jgi:hypothetical protein
MSATLEPQTIAFPVEPLDGMYASVPSSKMPLGASPDMLNCYVRRDMLLKRPGFAQVGNAVHATERVMGLYSTLDIDDTTYLYAAHETGVRRYISGTDTWDEIVGVDLTGGSTRLFSWETSQNGVVFSQGLDQVMLISFSGATYAVLSANCPPAKYLTRFADRLYIANTIETAVKKPFRVRRSVATDHADWTGIGSGFNDLSEFPYHIKGMSKHGAQMLVASEEALWIAERTGISAAPARFDPMITGSGLYCPHVLTTKGSEHLGMSREGFWVFNGTQIVEVMTQVRDVIYDSLNAAKIQMNFAILRPSAKEWIVFLCLGSDATPGDAWIWNYGKDICYPWSFTGPVCATLHRQDASRTWNSLVGTWEEQSWEWTSSEGQEAFLILHTGHKNGKVYRWREDVHGDDGAAIACRWTSRDFAAADIFGVEERFRQIALKSLAIEYRDAGTAATLQFYLSADEGATWTGPFPIELENMEGTSGCCTAVLSEKISGNKIRWKSEHTSASETFKITRFIPEFELLGMPIAPDSDE